jgi:hypothetical protein
LAYERVEKLFQVFRIKTKNAFRQGTTGKKAKVAQMLSSILSLVAGNVTGGGGKATTTKT